MSELCRADYTDIMIKRLILESHLSDDSLNTYIQVLSCARSN